MLRYETMRFYNRFVLAWRMVITMHYKTLREEVAIHIREKILTGAFPPGDKIVESELSAELNVSRAPIREALMLMESEGLVTYSPNHGCTVRILTPRDVWQFYLLRANLEILSVRFCGGKLGEAVLDRMQKNLDRFHTASTANSQNELPLIDEAFHGEIVRACELPKLYETWQNYNGANVASFFTIRQTRPVHVDKQEATHSTILDSLKNGSQEEACLCIQKHYIIVCQSLFGEEEEKGRRCFSLLL